MLRYTMSIIDTLDAGCTAADTSATAGTGAAASAAAAAVHGAPVASAPRSSAWAVLLAAADDVEAAGRASAETTPSSGSWEPQPAATFATFSPLKPGTSSVDDGLHLNRRGLGSENLYAFLSFGVIHQSIPPTLQHRPGNSQPLIVPVNPALRRRDCPWRRASRAISSIRFSSTRTSSSRAPLRVLTAPSTRSAQYPWTYPRSKPFLAGQISGKRR